MPYPVNVEKAKIVTKDCQCIIVSKDKKYAYVADAESDQNLKIVYIENKIQNNITPANLSPIRYVS